MWEQERKDFDARGMADNLSMVNPVEEASRITLKEYLHHWRTKLIGHQIKKGKVRWGECHVFSQRGRNRGRPIAMGTRTDYAADAQQMEASEGSEFLLSDPQLLRRIRRLLSPWLTKPTHYNGLRNTLSRAFSQAVQDGLIDRNPMRDIQKISEPKREVLIPDDAYKEITAHLCIHKINRRKMDGTWQAKICDMIYMMSQQPIDVFGLEEDQIKDDE
jgi:hypothetical protein